MARYETVCCDFDTAQYGRPILDSRVRYTGDDFGEALKEANYRGQCLEENSFEVVYPDEINESFADSGQFPYQTFYAAQDGRTLVTLVYVRDHSR